MEKLSDEKALEYLDILFPYFPTNFQFVTNEIIFNSPIKEDAYDYGNKITFLLIDSFKYADSNDRYFLVLNEKGRAAQKAGGHIKYEKYLELKEHQTFLPLDLPAEKPNAQPIQEDKKITAKIIFMSLWDVISKNPLISGIIALIIGSLILKHYHII